MVAVSVIGCRLVRRSYGTLTYTLGAMVCALPTTMSV
jgi:hypothetical protein